MLNLIDKLSPVDNDLIKNYIRLYGIKYNYIGNELYLAEWAKNKKRLYHLLGENLIYKVPFEYDKPKNILRKELEDIVLDMDFAFEFSDRIWNYYQTQSVGEDEKEYLLSIPERNALLGVLKVESLMADEIPYTIKYKMPDKKKILQLQKGMKPLRAAQKIFQYFGWDLTKEYEEFRIAHSMIFNEKKIMGNLCFSIHPMDFMTMSDNDSGWSSCMSWMEDNGRGGCYRVGTVEMMNSNNVICCYLEASTPMYIAGIEEPEYTWNNKRWRQLVYVTNDIIMTGKAYPYPNEQLSIKILETLRELSKKNLNRTYTFGPELYEDMIHISSLSRMENNHYWRANNPKKHNIIFETKGMYNDMLNDSKTNYYCIRNKVPKMKIVSVSGKAPCLCCGKSVLEENDDNYENDYNERYCHCSKVICKECNENFKCGICKKMSKDSELLFINGMKVCLDCYSSGYLCPDCGSPFMLGNINYRLYMKIDDFNVPIEKDYIRALSMGNDSKGIVRYCACDKCIDKLLIKHHEYKNTEEDKNIKAFNFPMQIGRDITLDDYYYFYCEDGNANVNKKHEVIKNHLLENLKKLTHVTFS